MAQAGRLSHKDEPAPLFNRQAVEADAFFCFTNLMAEVRDHFCSKLDHTELGITAKITPRFRAPEARPTLRFNLRPHCGTIMASTAAVAINNPV